MRIAVVVAAQLPIVVVLSLVVVMFLVHMYPEQICQHLPLIAVLLTFNVQ
ncbi:MAG: hypothetical protein KDA87_02950 [Planctomycetales bacterium]|nr:hypothetical protein [Planctomycetales bacterium]